ASGGITMSKKEKAARGGPRKSFDSLENKPDLRSLQAFVADTVFAGSTIQANLTPELQELTFLLTRDASQKQGPRAFESTKKGAAFHEAGHAIVFAAEGDAVESVRISRIRDKRCVPGWKGFTRLVNPDHWIAGPFVPPAEELRAARGLIAVTLRSRFSTQKTSAKGLPSMSAWRFSWRSET